MPDETGARAPRTTSTTSTRKTTRKAPAKRAATKTATRKAPATKATTRAAPASRTGLSAEQVEVLVRDTADRVAREVAASLTRRLDQLEKEVVRARKAVKKLRVAPARSGKGRRGTKS